LAPNLDTYEQAIYLYLLRRHSRLQGADEITVGFKSARRRMAKGIGNKDTPMSEKHLLREAQVARVEGMCSARQQ